jgi:hypothetical protein
MTQANETDAALAQARQRLTRSRQALLEQMRNCSTASAQTQRAADEGAQGGLWRGLMQAWQNHPAALLVQALAPVLRQHTRQHPWQVLAISGLLGGAVVLLRPWRLLPLGALLMSAARAVPLSQLLSAWLHQGGPAGSEGEQKPGFKRDQKRDQKREQKRDQNRDYGGDKGSQRPH